jgi:hypothetical protein
MILMTFYTFFLMRDFFFAGALSPVDVDEREKPAEAETHKLR